MDFEILIILGIASIMGLTDYFGHKISGLASKYREKLLSLSAGILISLLFLILLPDLLESEKRVDLLLFSMLAGFLVMHCLEKQIYMHKPDKNKLLLNLKEIHVFGFGLDNFMVGFIIASVLKSDFSIGLILNLSLPLFLQMLASSISVNSIDAHFENIVTKISKIVLSLLPVGGGIFGLILEAEETITNYVLGFVLGILLYMIIRDVIPKGEKGSTRLFILGNVISISLWVIFSNA